MFYTTAKTAVEKSLRLYRSWKLLKSPTLFTPLVFMEFPGIFACICILYCHLSVTDILAYFMAPQTDGTSTTCLPPFPPGGLFGKNFRKETNKIILYYDPIIRS